MTPTEATKVDSKALGRHGGGLGMQVIERIHMLLTHLTKNSCYAQLEPCMHKHGWKMQNSLEALKVDRGAS